MTKPRIRLNGSYKIRYNATGSIQKKRKEKETEKKEMEKKGKKNVTKKETSKTRYACLICGGHYSNKSNLIRHMRTTHARTPDSEKEWSPGVDGILRNPAHRALRPAEQAKEVIRARAEARTNRRRRPATESSEETIPYFKPESEENAGVEVKHELEGTGFNLWFQTAQWSVFARVL